MSAEAPRDRELPAVIVLAAGRSSRMGVPKGLVDVDGEPWLSRQIASVRASGARRAIVVLGHAHERYVAALPWLDESRPRSTWGDFRVDVVVNRAPERGSFSSLVTGCARRVGEDAFVLPVDVPCPDLSVWAALAAARTTGVDACVPVHEGRGGHPVLCAARLLDGLESIAISAPEARLDEQLRRAPNVRRIDVADPRVKLNLNTPADWESILR